MHPGQPRDIDLDGWLNGIGFHPADTELKQLGHEAARQLVGLLGTHLHQLLPPGRDKSLVFSHLEDVLMRSNRALALGGGPAPHPTYDEAGQTARLREFIAETRDIAEEHNARLPEDDRIEEYKATQRARIRARIEQHRAARTETTASAFSDYTLTVGAEGGPVQTLAVESRSTADAEVVISAMEHDEGENLRQTAKVPVTDPTSLEEVASVLLAAANWLRRAQA